MADTSSTSSCLRVSRGRYNVLTVSIAFTVLFAAYNTLQNYATSTYPAGLGNQSLAVLYAACAVSVFAAPGLTNQLGPRWTMVFGASLYVAYMASVIQIIPWVVLLMSTVIGFGGAILWIALGVFITQNSTKKTYGQNTGIFWSIFQLCSIVGNLATYLVFSHLSSTSLLFAGFTVTGVLGTLMLLLTRKPENEATNQTAAAGGAHGSLGGILSEGSGASQQQRRRPGCGERVRAFCADIGSVLRLMRTRNMALLMPMYFFSGLELSVSWRESVCVCGGGWGGFVVVVRPLARVFPSPLWCSPHSHPFPSPLQFWSGEFSQMINTNVIGLVLTFVGIGEVVGGVLFGKLSDVVGRSASISLGAVLYATGLGLACYMRATAWMPAPVIAGAPLVAYIAALCFGLGDSSFNANCYAICAQLYHDGPTDDGEGGSGAAAKAGRVDDGDEAEGGRASLLLNDGADRPRADVSASVEGVTHSVGAFTVFQLVQNLGSCLGFFYGLPLPMHDPDPSTGTTGSYTQAYIQFALLLVATVTFVTVDRLSIAEERRKEEEEGKGKAVF
jgi:MFS family permease